MKIHLVICTIYDTSFQDLLCPWRWWEIRILPPVKKIDFQLRSTLAGTEPLNEDGSPPHHKALNRSSGWRIRWHSKIRSILNLSFHLCQTLLTLIFMDIFLSLHTFILQWGSKCSGNLKWSDFRSPTVLETIENQKFVSSIRFMHGQAIALVPTIWKPSTQNGHHLVDLF